MCKPSIPLMAMAFLGWSVLLAQPAPPPPPEPPAPPPAPFLSGAIRTERHTEPLVMGGKLRVYNRNGSIRVNGWDKPEVSLVAEIRDTERRKVDLVIRRQDGALDVEAVFQKSSWSFGFVSSPRCEMSLSVPRKLLGYFRTTNGSIQASGLGEQSYVHCETTNGNVKLKDLAGEVRAETTNGTIEALRLKARIKGHSTNGRIWLEEVDGGIQVQTTNGTIRAKGLDGWGEGIRMETTNGSIDVELGRATGDLLAENSHGSLDIRVPGAQVIEMSKHRAKVRIPGRSQRILLETTHGSISIR